MEVIVNGERQDVDVSECANLAELVAEVERFETAGQECVVVAIEIDGEKLSPEQLTGLESRGIEGVASVSIDRRPARAVARSVLLQGADYCGEIVKAIGRTVEHFRAGRSDLANELFAHVSDSLTVLVGISASAAHVLAENAEELLRFQRDLQPWLEQLIEAQSSEDPILIGDLLEFEIAPRVENWGHGMRALAELVAGDESATSPELSS